MRRLALLCAGGAIWLFLAAIPVFADGGPHISTLNNGSTGISADSCAGCHRAHTAQGPLLLNAANEEALCLTCHGATGTGATTDVESGIQYTLAAAGAGQVRGGVVLGALRNGGFVEARIASADTARLSYLSGTNVRQTAKVPVLAAGQPVTSSHLDLDGAGGVVASGVAWGNINGTPGVTFDAVANPGAALALSCATCHNPHGNGQYRILNPIPGTTDGVFTQAPAAVTVTDAPLPPAGDTRNYTVIQIKGTEGTPSTYLLNASQVVSGGYANTAGDYLHRRVPWNGTASGTSANDAPNGLPTTFNGQINTWCAQCHSRYLAISGATFETDSGDAIFKYRHSNTSNKPCTTCHVAHGSNAVMDGVYSANLPYPGGTAAPVGDSRLLKINNRGTCQACHDPTGTTVAGTFYGPTPVPLVP